MEAEVAGVGAWGGEEEARGHGNGLGTTAPARGGRSSSYGGGVQGEGEEAEGRRRMEESRRGGTRRSQGRREQVEGLLPWRRS